MVYVYPHHTSETERCKRRSEELWYTGEMIEKATRKSNANELFQKEYARLNAEQRKAVDAIDGPVFVIAGPGTGKTQVLTLRIANILKKTDTPPEAIVRRLTELVEARGPR